MGIGNLHNVLGAYDGGRPVPYAQLYFDTAPDHHAAAYRLLSGFGDDSWLYYWRVLGAVQIMHLYRTDRGALRRLAALQTRRRRRRLRAASAGPHDLASPIPARSGRRLPAPHARPAAQQRRPPWAWPVDPSMGTGASRGRRAARAVPRAAPGGAAAADRARRPGARAVGRPRAAAVHSTVTDAAYQQRTGDRFAAATTGWSFQIARRRTSAGPRPGLSGDARPAAVAEPDRLGAGAGTIDVTSPWPADGREPTCGGALDARAVGCAVMTDAIRTPDELFEGLPDFPFAPHWRQFDGLRLAHVDEGDGRRWCSCTASRRGRFCGAR